MVCFLVGKFYLRFFFGFFFWDFFFHFFSFFFEYSLVHPCLVFSMSVAATRVIEYNVPFYYKAPPAPVFVLGAPVRVVHQTHRGDLNGRPGVSLGRDGMRTLVLTASGDTLSVADEHLELVSLAPGLKVILVALEDELCVHNGKRAVLKYFSDGAWIIEGIDGLFSVKPVNVVADSGGEHGSSSALLGNAAAGVVQPIAGKKRRLISNLVSAAAGDALRPLVGSTSLLSSTPMQGPSSRLIAIDASIALSPQQPILKRCGTLRKLVHGFPGFAQLAVCVVAKLHLDPSHPGRVVDPSDVEETIRIASLLTDGKLDGVPRKDVRELISSGAIEKFEPVLRIADRYCGANHLIFAIDTNFAGVRDTIVNLVQQITSGGAVSWGDQHTITPQQNPTTDPVIAPFNKALTELMQNRYAAVKAAVDEPMMEDDDDVDDVQTDQPPKLE